MATTANKATDLREEMEVKVIDEKSEYKGQMGTVVSVDSAEKVTVRVWDQEEGKQVQFNASQLKEVVDPNAPRVSRERISLDDDRN